MWKRQEPATPERLKDLMVDEARGVLAGTSDLLAASCKILDHLAALGFNRDDPDFEVFRCIEDEIDHLPIGEERDNWSTEALARKDPEVRAAQAWAETVGGLDACRSVIARFSPPMARPDRPFSDPDEPSDAQ